MTDHETNNPCMCETLHEELVDHMMKFHDQWVMIERVPAMVCEKCGARYFSPDVYERIVTLLNQPDAPRRHETLTVYELGTEHKESA